MENIIKELKRIQKELKAPKTSVTVLVITIIVLVRIFLKQ